MYHVCITLSIERIVSYRDIVEILVKYRPSAECEMNIN